MTIHFSDTSAAMLVKKNAQKLRHVFGTRDISNIEPHTMTWDELNKAQSSVAKTAREMFDTITESTPEERASEIERTFDVLMELHDALGGEKDTRTEIGNRAPRAVGGDPRRPIGPNATVRGEDGAPYRNIPDVRTIGLKPEERMSEWVEDREGRSEYADLPIGDYLRSMVCGAKTDLEKRALSEGTDSAGGYTVPTALASQMIDLLRAQSVCSRAGAPTIPLTTKENLIAKVASDPTPAWRSEEGSITVSDPTFTSVSLQPKSLACIVKVSRELMEDSLNLPVMLPQILATSMAKEWDRVALLGSGTAPEPEGVANVSGIGTNALSADLTSYAPLVTARTAVKNANADPTAYIMSVRDEGTFAGLTATDNQPLNAPRQVAEIPWLTTTAIPTDGGAGSDESTIFCGDFRHLYMGVRTELTIMISKELYMETGQYAFLAWFRGDIAVAHPGAFHTTTAITG